MVEEGRDVASLPVDDSRDFLRVMWVDEDVVIMQIIMPEAWLGDGSVLRDKDIDNLPVPC